MRCASVLLALGLVIGCSPSTPKPTEQSRNQPSEPNEPRKPSEPTEPAKLTEKDIEEAKGVVKGFIESLNSGTQEEQIKFLLGLLPTDREIEIAFPKHMEGAKKYYAMIREAIPKSAKVGRKDEDGKVMEVTVKDARIKWFEWKRREQRLLAITSPSVLIIAPWVKRERSEGPSPPFMRVNDRWTLLLEVYDLIDYLKLPEEPQSPK